MNSSADPSDEWTFVVPEPMIRLGKALEPLLERLARGLDEPGPTTPRPGPSLLAGGQGLFDRMVDSVTLLTSAVTSLGNDLSKDIPMTDADIRRNVDRLEEAIFRILSGREDARAHAAWGDDTSGWWKLVAEMHEHWLGEIRRWLSDLVFVGKDPAGFAAERKLAGAKTVTVEINLVLTEWPRLGELVEWIEVRSRAISKEAKSQAWDGFWKGLGFFFLLRWLFRR